MKIYKYILAIAVVSSLAVSCNDDDDDNPVTGGTTTNFTGTFVQEDQMGRPGINTVFTPTDMDENNFNVTIPANGVANFQPTFQSTVEGLYTAYSNTAGTTLSYENNILGLDLPTLTTALALDVLQVAPDAPTSYFANNVPLTGRTLEDDVIDISLILLFGGMNGDRFSGQDTDGDGVADLPNLVSDNVDLESNVTQSSFPYLVPAQF